jgi:hypothetical protein
VPANVIGISPAAERVRTSTNISAEGIMDDTSGNPRAARIRWTVGGAVWLAGCLLWLLTGPAVTQAQGNWTIPPAPPALQNPRLECEAGFVAGFNPAGKDVLIPKGWTVDYVLGSAQVLSTRLSIRKVCDRVMYNADGKGWVDVTHGGEYDSLYIRAQDIETPPNPGKPFDVVLYQRTPATIGGNYSVSAWMVSLCRNYNDTQQCPPGEYIAKTVGLDPLGGDDPNAKSVVWAAENRANYVDEQGGHVGWQNIYVGTRALSTTLTVFLRMTAPYDQRGNSGFMDEVSLIRGPYARFKTLPAQIAGGEALTVVWEGLQSEEIATLPGGTYRLHYDVQVRPVGGEWRDLAIKTTQTSQAFTPLCVDTTYEFRVRAGTEQPDGSGGVAPNHRYPGAWSLPEQVYFAAPGATSAAPVAPDADNMLYLPNVRVNPEC